MKKIKKFFMAIPKAFWAAMTICLGVGTIILALISIFLYYTKETVVDALKKKTKKRLNENDKIIKQAKKDIKDSRDAVSNVDDTIRYLDEKYGERMQ